VFAVSYELHLSYIIYMNVFKKILYSQVPICYCVLLVQFCRFTDTKINLNDLQSTKFVLKIKCCSTNQETKLLGPMSLSTNQQLTHTFCKLITFLTTKGFGVWLRRLFFFFLHHIKMSKNLLILRSQLLHRIHTFYCHFRFLH